MMENLLNQIYDDYKRGVKPNDKKPLRKIAGPSQQGGVPDPVFDGAMDPDGKINCCSKCGSLNISVDLSTNKLSCNECKESGDKPNRVDFQRQMDQAREDEERKIIEAMKLGHSFYM